jgi:hypothetical protein
VRGPETGAAQVNCRDILSSHAHVSSTNKRSKQQATNSVLQHAQGASNFLGHFRPPAVSVRPVAISDAFLIPRTHVGQSYELTTDQRRQSRPASTLRPVGDYADLVHGASGCWGLSWQPQPRRRCTAVWQRHRPPLPPPAVAQNPPAAHTAGACCGGPPPRHRGRVPRQQCRSTHGQQPAWGRQRQRRRQAAPAAAATAASTCGEAAL